MRHIRRMRQIYAERRGALARALSEEVPQLDIALKPGGMHLLTRLPRGMNDVKLITKLKEHGIGPSSLSECGIHRPYEPGLVIGFTNVQAKKASQAARALASALRQAG